MTDAITRRWDGLVKRADLSVWIEKLQEKALPLMRGVDGWQGISCLAARDGDPCRVSVTTKWKDEAALRAFAGDSLTLAVMPKFMAPFFVDYDAHATLHTEIFVETMA